MTIILCGAMMAVLLLIPSSASDAAKDALRIWGLDVVPSLFPYMVLCQCLSSSLRSRQSASGFVPILLGLVGGSPAGSASLSIAAQNIGISDRRLWALTALTGIISPMFFLGPVSSWFHSGITARFLLLSQVSGALLAAICASFLFRNTKTDRRSESRFQAANSQTDPIVRSVNAVLSVGGCIVFYSVAAECLSAVIPFHKPGVLESIHAILEVSGGLRALADAQLHETIRGILAAAACGFSGLSILSQNLLFLRPLGITMRQLVMIGILRAAGSALTMAALLGVS